ncbi:tetratricopeptide repeat protein [Thauera sp.]|jgi:tetratricopeptide (TPR) repeat protein|uniref:tetratricopeptide repeat protein n=1 Tax=Thauera sp. TaxID=1905334 RepID=UPI002A36E1E4|nr:tetratricopeptide repeat protein [Thauera sp.]MDX9885110.1 tetratricopeptide repeat protein [Thauera sp.]
MTVRRYAILGSVLAFALQLPVAFAQGQAVCGSLNNGYGPFDYRTQKDRLEVVERFHFTPEVETLSKGKSSSAIGADIAYTLRAFPNHHRALMAMLKLAAREKTSTPKGSDYTMSCWFDRAERFRADDAMVKVIHGIYLIQTGKSGEALGKLEAARALDGGSANVHYNLGLAYFNLGQYEKALTSAHAAYGAGFPLPGLRDKLKRAGRWREGSPTPDAGAAVGQGREVAPEVDATEGSADAR